MKRLILSLICYIFSFSLFGISIDTAAKIDSILVFLSDANSVFEAYETYLETGSLEDIELDTSWDALGSFYKKFESEIEELSYTPRVLDLTANLSKEEMQAFYDEDIRIQTEYISLIFELEKVLHDSKELKISIKDIIDNVYPSLMKIPIYSTIAQLDWFVLVNKVKPNLTSFISTLEKKINELNKIVEEDRERTDILEDWIKAY